VSEDADRNGASDRHWTFATGFFSPLGIAFNGADLYVSSHNRITILRDGNLDGVADQSQSSLPTFMPPVSTRTTA
jgi:glucose/arabinose dehydrogenase